MQDGEVAARRSSHLRIARRFGIYAVLLLLLYFALRNAPLGEIWDGLRALQPWQLGIVLLLNSLVILFISLRWWVIVRAYNPGVPLQALIRYRLSVFGVSYFTPGPQVGGEPLQVLYLERNHGVSFARATSAVIMDKLIELLANFVLVCLGLAAAARLGATTISASSAVVAGVPLAVVLAWPAAHLVLLRHRKHPVSALLRLAAPVVGTRRWARLIMLSERMAGAFTHRRLPWLLISLACSFAAVGGMAVEFALIARFLGVALSATQVLAGLTAAVLAFLLPLPGGLGALEASQVLVLGSFGVPASVAVGVALVMRGRDILNGGLGLLLAGGELHGRLR